jgi:hypothetical protein
MGSHVRLTADPAQIEPEAWLRVYRESWHVLKAYPNEALNAAWRELNGENIPMYVRDLTHTSSLGSGWRVCGDARSKLTSETFVFPERYGSAQADMQPRSDLLIEAAYKGYIDGPSLFSQKTQGHPYHELVLAVATLVENRFPGAALAHSELSIEDGEQSCNLSLSCTWRAYVAAGGPGSSTASGAPTAESGHRRDRESRA